ncbi:MAG: NAD(P)/FAD-dependent oxidoreductase [Pseudomonadota bacterium]
MQHPNTAPQRPKVVIVGAGFGGLSAARALAKAPVEVEIVDRRNYHLFQPLLYQVATADLSPADVAWPIRGVFSRQDNVAVTLADVSGVDLKAKRVLAESGEIPYDYLVLATGSHHSYFGNDDWADHAPGLKRIVDATEIRKRVLMAFERAEVALSETEQQRQLTFVVVGGGPTGVEMAGAIAELARFTLARDFRRIRSKDARVILIEAGPRVLAAFPERLSAIATRSLEGLGVEVRLNTRVEDVDAQGVALAGAGQLPAATTIWGAGVQVEHVGHWLGVETDRAGRVPVEPDLSLAGHPEVFVVGDAAKIAWRDGRDVPGIAPAAKQAGRHVAAAIAAERAGQARQPFRYRHFGNLATIGRHAAVIDFGRFQLSGALAWWLWGLAHIYFLIGVRAPIFVGLSWLWSYLTYAKGARLITGTRPRILDPVDALAETERHASDTEGLKA